MTLRSDQEISADIWYVHWWWSVRPVLKPSLILACFRRYCLLSGLTSFWTNCLAMRKSLGCFRCLFNITVLLRCLRISATLFILKSLQVIHCSLNLNVNTLNAENEHCNLRHCLINNKNNSLSYNLVTVQYFVITPSLLMSIPNRNIYTGYRLKVQTNESTQYKTLYLRHASLLY